MEGQWKGSRKVKERQTAFIPCVDGKPAQRHRKQRRQSLAGWQRERKERQREHCRRVSPLKSSAARVQSELQPSDDGRSSRRRTGIDQWNFEELEQSSTATMGEGGRERRGRRSSRRSRKKQREEQGGLPKSAKAVESIAAAAVGLQTGGDGGRGSASQSFNAGADTQ